MTINYNEKIPNNVDLSGDKDFSELWKTGSLNFLTGGKNLAPGQNSELNVYLRTAISVGKKGMGPF
ncbi:MAG: hypothetical protein CM1200mP30_32300 [Pseudomonadota bacterium]|nr:MAG: hypothetical protein CM1200mP30_32300 [Pseudomonadota bacterium]